MTSQTTVTFTLIVGRKSNLNPYQEELLDYVQEEFLHKLNHSQVLKNASAPLKGLMPSCSRPVHKKNTLLGMIASEAKGTTTILRIFSQLLTRYQNETSQKSYISSITAVRISILHYGQQNSRNGTTR